MVNGGTVNLLASASGVTVPLAATPANGLTINNATVTMGSSTNTVAGQIAAGNIVTMNGVGNLNLFGDNTLAGLVLNNIGGGSGNLQVNTFSTATAAGTGASGVLSIGSSGIVATSSNITSATIVVGRLDFGATAKTIDVAPIAANGVAVSPLIAGLQLQGIVGVVCPQMVYPYLRAIISDICTRAGFPPILLTEVNFQAMFEAQQQAASSETGSGIITSLN